MRTAACSRANSGARTGARKALSIRRLLVATNNPGKLREYYDILSGLPFQLISLREADIEQEVPEDGETFRANAIFKAQAYARLSGELALADDSGLAVDALDGAPGVRSARYGGPDATDQDRVSLLLQRLAGVPKDNRRARFICVIAIADPAGLVGVVDGEVEGYITNEPRGSGGFGYDPVFFLPALGHTMAELPTAEKNRISHRAQAGAKARELLARYSAEAGAR